jgi:hypothetical protein
LRASARFGRAQRRQRVDLFQQPLQVVGRQFAQALQRARQQRLRVERADLHRHGVARRRRFGQPALQAQGGPVAALAVQQAGGVARRRQAGQQLGERRGAAALRRRRRA